MLPGCGAAGWADVVSVSLTGLGGSDQAKVSKCLAQITQIKQGFSQKSILRFARSAKKVLLSVKIPA
jgi:hypothetical protein